MCFNCSRAKKKDNMPLPPITDIRNGGVGGPVWVARIGDFIGVRIRRVKDDNNSGVPWNEVVQVESGIPKRLLEDVPKLMAELKGGVENGGLDVGN